MDKKDFCFFDWKITEECNIGCSYCVNSSGPNKASSLSDKTVRIAEKIADLSNSYRKVRVNLTGGEPTTARHIRDCLCVLSQADNVTITLITNLRSVAHVEEFFPSISKIFVSLHISYRSDAEIERVISTIGRNKDKTEFFLSQVDYQLNDESHAKMARIEDETGMKITLQPFITPWGNKETTVSPGGVGKETAVAGKLQGGNPPSSLGKRCCLDDVPVNC